MTLTQLLARYPPQCDVKTQRQAFACPHCGTRLLGPDPEEKRPTWIIPLVCCHYEEIDPDWLETPPPPTVYAYHDRTLMLRRQMIWDKRTERRVSIWFPDSA